MAVRAAGPRQVRRRRNTAAIYGINQGSLVNKIRTHSAVFGYFRQKAALNPFTRSEYNGAFSAFDPTQPDRRVARPAGRVRPVHGVN